MLGDYVDYIVLTQLLFCLLLNVVVVIELFSIHCTHYISCVVQLFIATDWLDITRVADLNFLILHGLFCYVFRVPHVVVKFVWFVAKRATIMPMNSNWFNPVFCI